MNTRYGQRARRAGVRTRITAVSVALSLVLSLFVAGAAMTSSSPSATAATPAGAVACGTVLNHASEKDNLLSNVRNGMINRLETWSPSQPNTVSVLVNLTTDHGIVEETNALALNADGTRAYFTSHWLNEIADDSKRPPNGSKIYEYDLTTGSLRTWDTVASPASLTPDNNYRVRRGGVDPTSGIYYYSTSINGGTVQYLYALDPASGQGWYVGTVTTPTASDGESGDLLFSADGSMYLATGKNSTAYFHLVHTDGLLGGPTAQPVSLEAEYLNDAEGTGNGVGIAVGPSGYLYASNTSGEFFEIDPTTGSATHVGSIASGGSADLASCGMPNTLTVIKDVTSRHAGDQFALSEAWVQGGTVTELGEPVISELPDGELGPVDGAVVAPRLVVTEGRTYRLREELAGSGTGDLSGYVTTLECVDTGGGEPVTIVPSTTLTGNDVRSFDLDVDALTEGSNAAYHAVECTFTNSVNGSVAISKELTPGSFVDQLLEDDPGSVVATGRIECTSPDGETALDEEWSVAPGRTVTVSGLDPGDECTVTEDPGLFTDSGEPLDTHGLTWAEPIVTTDGEAGNTFTVADGPSHRVEVTNTLLGSFDLTKVVEGTDTEAAFEFTWESTASGYTDPDGDGPGAPVPSDTTSGSLTVRHDETAEPGLLFPAGTEVAFTESGLPPAEDGHEWQLEVRPETAVIGTDGSDGDRATVAVTATNTYRETPAVFTIDKAVVGDAAALPADTEYTITYTVDGGAARTATLTADDDPVRIEVPHRAQVVVTESELPALTGVTWGEPQVVGGDFTADNTAEPHAVTVTNTAEKVSRSFRVHKELEGSGAAAVPGSKSFTVDYSVNDGEQTGELTIRADGTVVDGPELTYGDSVTFEERASGRDSNVGGSQWYDVEITVDGEEVTADEPLVLDSSSIEPVEVTVTNWYAAERSSSLGQFALRKLLADGAEGASNQNFTVQWRASLVALPVTETVSGNGTWTRVTAPLTIPLIRTIYIKETATPPAPDGGRWAAPTYEVNGVPLTSRSPIDSSWLGPINIDADHVVDITVTNSLEPVDVYVQKRGGGAGPRRRPVRAAQEYRGRRRRGRHARKAGAGHPGDADRRVDGAVPDRRPGARHLLAPGDPGPGRVRAPRRTGTGPRPRRRQSGGAGRRPPPPGLGRGPRPPAG